jgi:dihydroneopterin aldolase
MDLSAAVKSDDLNDTADYVWLHGMVREEMAIRSKLIEHVAGRILSRLIEKYPQALSRKVFVKKFNPPVNGQLGVATVMLSN